MTSNLPNNFSASATNIALACSCPFNNEERSVVVEHVERFLAAFPAEMLGNRLAACAIASEADALIAEALEAGAETTLPASTAGIPGAVDAGVTSASSTTVAQTDAFIESRLDNESNWVKPLESITASSASPGDTDVRLSTSRGCTPVHPEGDGLASEMAEEKMRGDADDADASPSASPNPFAMPIPADLMYANFQVWRNPSKPRKPEWVVKARSARSGIELGSEEALTQHYMGFVDEPRRLRAKVRKQVKQGRVSTEWADYLCAVSEGMEPHAVIAQITKSVFVSGEKVPPKRSSKEREVFEQFAIMTLDPTRSFPVQLDLYLSVGEPISLTQFTDELTTKTDGSPRSPKAAQWVAQYDPDGFHAALKRDAKAVRRLLAERKQLTEFHPSTSLNIQMKAFWEPVALGVQDAQQRLDKIEDYLATDDLPPQVQTRIAALEHDNAELRATLRTYSEVLSELRQEIEPLRAALPALGAAQSSPEPESVDPLARAAKQAAEYRARQKGGVH